MYQSSIFYVVPRFDHVLVKVFSTYNNNNMFQNIQHPVFVLYKLPQY